MQRAHLRLGEQRVLQRVKLDYRCGDRAKEGEAAHLAWKALRDDVSDLRRGEAHRGGRGAHIVPHVVSDAPPEAVELDALDDARAAAKIIAADRVDLRSAEDLQSKFAILARQEPDEALAFADQRTHGALKHARKISAAALDIGLAVKAEPCVVERHPHGAVRVPAPRAWSVAN
jgi:hypothetical protein